MFKNLGAGDVPMKRKSAPPPPFGAKKPEGVAVMIGVGGKKPDEHEAAESPEEEGQEQYGEKLARDIEDAGASVGLDPVQARKAAGAMFAAVAKCLGGGEESDAEPPMGDMSPEGEM